MKAVHLTDEEIETLYGLLDGADRGIKVCEALSTELSPKMTIEFKNGLEMLRSKLKNAKNVIQLAK